MSICKNQLNR